MPRASLQHLSDLLSQALWIFSAGFLAVLSHTEYTACRNMLAIIPWRESSSFQSKRLAENRDTGKRHPATPHPKPQLLDILCTLNLAPMKATP